MNCFNHYESDIKPSNSKNYVYSLYGEVDSALSESSSISSDKVARTYKGVNMTEPTSEWILIPPGEHFVDFKTIATTSISSGTDAHYIRPYSNMTKTDIRYTPKDYNTHTITVTTSADGFLDSDPSSIEYSIVPYCIIASRVLTLGNILSTVNQIALYINDNLVDTFSYTTDSDWKVDLTDYPYHGAGETVYFHAIGNDFDIESTHSTANLTIPTPKLTIEGTVIKLTNVVSQAKYVDVYIDNNLFQTYEYNSAIDFEQDLSEGLGEAPEDASWDVESLGTTYGFDLNTTTGYYTSNNKGIHNSFALCKVNLKNPAGASVYVKIRNEEKQIEVISNTVTYRRIY